MGFQNDQFGHKTYDYTPKYDTLIDRDPDHRQSSGAFDIEDLGPKGVVGMMRVRGLGVLVIKGWGLNAHGISILSDDQLQFSDSGPDMTLPSEDALKRRIA